MQRSRAAVGATLLEILVAMLIIGLVATGIITAFIFSRRMTWRSGTELSGSWLVTETAEALRAPLANGLSLTPGIYVDQRMANAGPFAGVPPAFNAPAGANPIAGLNLPTDFRTRFQTNVGAAGTVAAASHGDGRLVVVEDGVDLDGDGQAGVDVSNPPDGIIDLRRVRVRVKWTSPAA